MVSHTLKSCLRNWSHDGTVNDKGAIEKSGDIKGESAQPKVVSGGAKKNPVAPSRHAKKKEALERFRDFTGHEVEREDVVAMDTPDVGFKIGDCDGVLYTTIRDGVTEHYIHKFKKRSRPQLISNFNGEQLYLIGGRYRFTERGIVDY